jgi:hypothetical protein
MLRKLGTFVEYGVFGSGATIDSTIIGNEKELYAVRTSHCLARRDPVDRVRASADGADLHPPASPRRLHDRTGSGGPRHGVSESDAHSLIVGPSPQELARSEHPTLRGLLTLYVACMPSTARGSHAAWVVDPPRLRSAYGESSGVSGSASGRAVPDSASRTEPTRTDARPRCSGGRNTAGQSSYPARA